MVITMQIKYRQSLTQLHLLATLNIMVTVLMRVFFFLFALWMLASLLVCAFPQMKENCKRFFPQNSILKTELVKKLKKTSYQL